MGLPMYRVGTGTRAPPPDPAITSPIRRPLADRPFNLAVLHPGERLDRQLLHPDDASQNRRPIQPFTKLDVTQPGFVAHGALITAPPRRPGRFRRGVQPCRRRPSAFSPELVGDATSPTRLQSIATFSTPLGPRQRLTLFSGQFRSDGVAEAHGIGTQSLFTALGGNVFYAPPSVTDFTRRPSARSA